MVHRLPELKEKGVPYLIPGVPVTCKVDNTEKYTTRSKVKLTHAASFKFYVINWIQSGITKIIIMIIIRALTSKIYSFSVKLLSNF